MHLIKLIQNSCKRRHFFDLMFNFARRGRENLRDLRKTSFTFSTDASGAEYCEMEYNEKTKKHQSVENDQTKPRIYGNDEITCPIKSLKLYLSKLEPNCDTFLQKTITRKNFKPETETVWYTAKCLGVNTIGNIMKGISKRLNLSKIYTNHCIRAACITLLAASGFEARQIMRVTGHKCESSLRAYDHDNTVQQKKDISAVLNNRHIPTQHNDEIRSTTTTRPTSTSTRSTELALGQRNETYLNFSVVNNDNSAGPSSNSVPQQSFVFSNNQNCNFYFNSSH